MLNHRERERLQDCLLLIQSARNILSSIRSEAIPDYDAIDKCFSHADRTITRLLLV